MTRLHIDILGNGPPLVLLHGWGWHSGIWSSLLPEMIQHFQLFLVDLPGFGKNRLLTTAYECETISQLIFAEVPATATWLGWSLGGMLAWWVATHYPQKMTKLITVATSPRFVEDIDWPGIPLLTLEKFAKTLVQQYDQTLQDFLILQLRNSSKYQELYTALQKQLTNYPQPTIHALLGSLQLLQSIDLRNDLFNMKIPSLHVFGSHDTLVPIRIVTKLQSILTHGHCEIIHRAGHIPFLVQQKEFLQLIYSAMLPSK